MLFKILQKFEMYNICTYILSNFIKLIKNSEIFETYKNINTL